MSLLYRHRSLKVNLRSLITVAKVHTAVVPQYTYDSQRLSFVRKPIQYFGTPNQRSAFGSESDSVQAAQASPLAQEGTGTYQSVPRGDPAEYFEEKENFYLTTSDLKHEHVLLNGLELLNRH